MHDYTPSAGALRTPRFAIEAESGTQVGEGNEWSLENTQATVFNGEDERLSLRAGHAEYSETNHTAVLTEGVDVRAGDVSLTLDSIRWDNQTGIAESDGPVRLEQGETWLEAASIRIDPDSELIYCRDFSGRIIFDKEPL